MELTVLKEAIEQAWDKDTCYPKSFDKWSQANPALGQCAVTALVVQDYLGGDLLYCKHADHFWNRTDQSGDVDFTKDQFPVGTRICIDEIQTREKVMKSSSSLKARTSERYRLLKQRVESKLTK